ncbi:MAG: hypothetical protein KAT16_07650 [Candidatus Heimdallarchaeota archaeon]|nr:hypothetical protein [Candidatus Heimdallarchaeota archaeon]
MTKMKSRRTAIKRVIQRYLGREDSESTDSWLNELQSIYIIRKRDGICLFSHHFKLGAISHIENQLVGMGFIAIANMMQEVVDSTSQLRLIDLDTKKVLIREKNNILAVLITSRFTEILNEKLTEFSVYFSKIFELQKQINEETCFTCSDDYALTADLVSLIFTDQRPRTLKLLPLIFKIIQKDPFQRSNETNLISKIVRQERSIER